MIVKSNPGLLSKRTRV